MSVILKQRTYRDENGKAVEHGDPAARFLVGPEGAKVTDQQALELGLKDGAIKKKRKTQTQNKGGKPDQDKESKGEDDKSADKTPDQGSPKPEDIASDSKRRSSAIKNIMMLMVKESKESGDAGKNLFTANKLPDTYVLSTRLEFQVSVKERDILWAELLKEVGEDILEAKKDEGGD